MDRIVYLAAGRAASGTTEEVVRADVLSELYGHHVDVLNVHGRVLIVAGAGEDTDLAGHEGVFPRIGGPAREPLLSPIFAPGSSKAKRYTSPSRSGRSSRSSPASSACSRSCEASRSPARRSATSARPEVGRLPGRCRARSGASCSATSSRPARWRRSASSARAGAIWPPASCSAPGSASRPYSCTWTRPNTAPPERPSRSSSARCSRSPATTIPLIVLLSAIVLALVLTHLPPLLLSSVNAEMASARGIPVRLVGVLYLLALALAAALAAITIGTILSTALLVGPAASALRLTTPARCTALLTAAGIGDRRHVARHRPRLRQLSLAARRTRLARELLRGDARVHHLPAVRAPRSQTPPASRPDPVRVPGGAAGGSELAAHSHVLRLHGQRLGPREHRRGRRGGRRLLHGPARLGVRRARDPQRILRRRRRRQPDRRQHTPRARRLLARRRYDDRPARPQRTPRRRDRPHARGDARASARCS